MTATPEFEVSWFIELDRATESLPTVLRKCAQYERYQASGREQQRRGVFPAVLWVMTDDRRARALARTIRSRYGSEQELFRVTTTDCFASVIVGARCLDSTRNNERR